VVSRSAPTIAEEPGGCHCRLYLFMEPPRARRAWPHRSKRGGFMRPLAAVLAAGVTFAITSSGCASARAGRLRKERLRHELDSFVYPRPLDEVWQEARRLLAERGYPLAGSDAEAVGQRPMGWAERIVSPARETGPALEGGLLQRMGAVKATSGAAQALDTGWTQYGERYQLEGWSQGDGSRVVFTHLKQDPTDRRSEASRDPELELELLRRLDPAAAARIERSIGSPPAG
jgi:hypothetical protein